MAFTELPFEVQRVRRASGVVDELGNETVSESRETVHVAGWAVPSAAEPKLAGHDRRTVQVELFAPVGAFRPEDAVQLPERADVLEVVGEPENFEHNPFGWSPGLEVVNLAGVV